MPRPRSNDFSDVPQDAPMPENPFSNRIALQLKTGGVGEWLNPAVLKN
jgi:hypothetical protein